MYLSTDWVLQARELWSGKDRIYIYILLSVLSGKIQNLTSKGDSNIDDDEHFHNNIDDDERFHNNIDDDEHFHNNIDDDEHFHNFFEAWSSIFLFVQQ